MLIAKVQIAGDEKINATVIQSEKKKLILVRRWGWGKIPPAPMKENNLTSLIPTSSPAMAAAVDPKSRFPDRRSVPAPEKGMIRGGHNRSSEKLGPST